MTDLIDLVPDGLQAVLAFVVAFATASVATPRLREAAIRFGIVDRPDGKLKNQTEILSVSTAIQRESISETRGVCSPVTC